jgi:hypothetical protein
VARRSGNHGVHKSVHSSIAAAAHLAGIVNLKRKFSRFD